MAIRKKFAAALLTAAAVVLCATTAYAAKIGETVDYVLYTDIVTYINDNPIQSYNIGGYTVVVAEDLAKYGFKVKWDGKERTLAIERFSYFSAGEYAAPEKNTEKIGKKAMPVLYTDIKVYFEGTLIRSHNINGKTAVYIDDIARICGNSYRWSAEERTLRLGVAFDSWAIDSGVPEKNDSGVASKNACEVINDYSHLKTSIDPEDPAYSFYVGDYLPASAGMRDYIESSHENYYKLRCGAYIAKENVKLLPDTTLSENRILGASMEAREKITVLKIEATENVPLTGEVKNGVFTVTLFNTPDGAPMTYTDNPIFKDVTMTSDAAKQSVTYTLNLIHPDNFYGFEVVYEDGNIYINVKNPLRKIEGDKPLQGLTIVVDAGHGGGDHGTLGYNGTNGKTEKTFNLEIALELEKKLKSLGAEVIMIRTTDTTVEIYSRMDTLVKINPDLCVSVHHNSAESNSSATGLETYYCDESGKLLAKSCSNVAAAELNRVERATQYNTYAILRNRRFPATIIEMLFLNNPREYEIAMTAGIPELSANAIANGIIEWINRQQQFVK